MKLNIMPTPESKTSEIQVVPEDQSYMLIKPDALRDGCAPSIYEMLYESGISIEKVYGISLTKEDGEFLYGDDIQNARDSNDPVMEDYRVRGAHILEGECLILQLSMLGHSKEETDEVLRKLKGVAYRTEYTIRGRLCFPLPEKTNPKFPTREVENRAHFPRDEQEEAVLRELMRKHNFIFS